ncbi:acyltransferase [Streptomyces sp. MB09-01]|uniref:acyltransferase family protein n=1 Tax=Streptomyces sp. MB09-01 TaxID=3028666 RepID=UPI0029AADBAB|nr:acyltransferase [Streptomyces sp. MB09-01]MDX3537053.1 acyltransferase [Streptomyces sp. MB09-01]
MKFIPPLTQRTAAAPAAAPGARLGWLDALRGIAALIVALHHFDVLRMLPFGGMIWRNFDMGLFGVMLFFIVSGYIIPASLERRGDVRGFWIGRIFRIYPALIAAFVLSIMMLPDGDGSVALLRTGDDPASLVANGLMLQDLLGVINGMNVTWTLCYEMVFYFFVTALFTRGLHRHSAPIAVTLAGVALAIGTAVGTQLLSAEIGSTRQLLLIVTPLVLVGLACVLSGKRMLTGTGALLLAGVGLVLVTLNGRAPAFETWMIFATMFAGTVVYRAQHGQLARVPALLSCGFVVVAGVLVGWLYNHGEALERTWSAGWKAWSIAYLAAWVLFGIGFLLRGRRFPKALTWLGAISFSVYLLHIPLLRTVEPLVGVPPQPSSTLGRFAWTAIFLGVVLAVSYLMYRLVEMPMQRLGRRVQKTAERRWPRSVPTAPVTPAAPAEAATVLSGTSRN